MDAVDISSGEQPNLLKLKMLQPWDTKGGTMAETMGGHRESKEQGRTLGGWREVSCPPLALWEVAEAMTARRPGH